MALERQPDGHVPPMSEAEALAYHQAQLEALEIKTRQVCADTWSTLPEDPERRKALLEQVISETIGTLGDISDELGAQYVVNPRVANGYEPGPISHSVRESPSSVRWRRGEIERLREREGDQAAFALFERRMVASVLGRARNTVVNSAAKAGNGWCRVPEPGACWFCLMLASRGAVYQQDTATTTKSGGRYHAHCRCTAAEVFNDDHLPPATAACVDWYAQHGSFDRDDVESGAFSAATGLISSSVEAADDARLGRSRLPEDFTPTVMEPQALLAIWPEPDEIDMQVILHGKAPTVSRSRKRKKWRGGHGPGARVPGKTEFPTAWTDDDIYKATILTMMDPQLAQIDGDRRTYRRDVHGIIVEVSWYLEAQTGTMVYRHTIPVAGQDVYKNNEKGQQEYVVPYDTDLLTTRIMNHGAA